MPQTFIAHSVLGDQLMFRRMSGHEEMGRLFMFHVDLLSKSNSLDPKALLGTDMTVEIDLTTAIGGSGTRYLSGQVTGFKFAGPVGDAFGYQATLQPWLWLATRRSDFRIFQNQTVPDVVQQVLAPYGFVVENRLSYSYRSWDYMVQYGETDFNFISRMLEHEGAYYYFEHQNGSHKLVLADDIGSHRLLPNGMTTIPYYPKDNGSGSIPDEDFLDSWNALQDIASGEFAADDYDFTKPRAALGTYQAQPAGHAQDSWEVFHWPGGYTQLSDGDQYARVRIEQQEAERQTIHGIGNARNLAPGYLFDMSNYPRSDQNQRYLITSADYHFTENVQLSGAGTGSTATPTTYRLGVDAVPSTVPWRSQCITEKPRTTGPQTAVVTGPAGEEIYTDQYGRVKVHFFWDRYGSMDENSSFWVRVSQAWAGSNYGTMHMPRIGQEVIVDFLNGDPDYPIITGRVYNADQMPPWDLPANKTQSGIKTRSSLLGAPGPGLGNGPGDANVLRFEDLKGSEQLWMHAQKDQLIEVENNEVKWVGNNRDKTIDGNETVTVHGNRIEQVDLNEQITIGRNQQLQVGIDRLELVGDSEIIGIAHVQGLLVGLARIKGVGLLEADLIGLAWLTLVGLLQAEIVGLASLEVDGLLKMIIAGLAYSTNAGVLTLTDTGLVQMTNVGGLQMTNVLAGQFNDIGGAQANNIGGAQANNIGAAQLNDIGAGQLNFIGAVQLTAIGDDGLVLCGDLYGIIADKFLAIGDSLAGMISNHALLLKCGDSMIAMTPDAIIISAGAVMIN